MTHLTEQQLSALLDDALTQAERRMADAHLLECADCRAALALLGTQDEQLRAGLHHEPGDAYFETFARRVDDRIRAEGATPEGAARAREAGADEAPVQRPARMKGADAAPWWDVSSWFRSPGRLAWAGGVAVLVVGAGIAFMTVRESGMPALRDAKLDNRANQAAPQAEAFRENEAPADLPYAGSEADALGRVESKNGPAASAPAAGADDAASPARVREMRRTESGEDVPVSRDEGPPFAQAPSPAAPSLAPGEARYAPRQRRATPLDAVKKTEAAKEKVAEEKPALEQAKTADREAGNKQKAGEGSTASLADKLENIPVKTLEEYVGGDGARRLSSALDSNARGQSIAADHEVCGVVVDAAGRPLRGAQVVLAERGRTASTDASGRFCIAMPTGARTLSVMAVGFVTGRADVQVAEGMQDVRVTMKAVDVLGTPSGGAGLQSPLRGRAQPGFNEDLDVLADTTAARMRNAQRLESLGERDRSAARFEEAALEWSRVLAAVPEGRHADLARHGVATSRYHAWELEPNLQRQAAAQAAIRAYLAKASPGAERDRVQGWFERLGR